MRRLLPLLAVLFVLPILGSDSPKGYDDATEANNIQGSWELTASQLNGEQITSRQYTAIFHSGTYTDDYGNDVTIQGSYRLDPSRRPSHIDCIPSSGSSQGKAIKFIYQIEGDTLKSACLVGEYNERRPQGFSDDHLFVQTFKRVR